METIRWAFRLADWHPSKEQWLIASSCIQAEEKNRIGKFVFQKDVKSALVLYFEYCVVSLFIQKLLI